MGEWPRQHTRTADVLVPNWVLGKPAAFDLSVTSMLNTQVFQQAYVTAGSAALAAQEGEGDQLQHTSKLSFQCIILEGT